MKILRKLSDGIGNQPITEGVPFRKEGIRMNARRIEKAWRAGEHDIAIRLLKAMIFEAGLTQKTVMD